MYSLDTKNDQLIKKIDF
jgi:hypothetical protein